jgi:hypothetical protein
MFKGVIMGVVHGAVPQPMGGGVPSGPVKEGSFPSGRKVIVLKESEKLGVVSRFFRRVIEFIGRIQGKIGKGRTLGNQLLRIRNKLDKHGKQFVSHSEGYTEKGRESLGQSVQHLESSVKELPSMEELLTAYDQANESRRDEMIEELTVLFEQFEGDLDGFIKQQEVQERARSLWLEVSFDREFVDDSSELQTVLADVEEFYRTGDEKALSRAEGRYRSDGIKAEICSLGGSIEGQRTTLEGGLYSKRVDAVMIGLVERIEGLDIPNIEDVLDRFAIDGYKKVPQEMKDKLSELRLEVLRCDKMQMVIGGDVSGVKAMLEDQRTIFSENIDRYTPEQKQVLEGHLSSIEQEIGLIDNLLKGFDINDQSKDKAIMDGVSGALVSIRENLEGYRGAALDIHKQVFSDEMKEAQEAEQKEMVSLREQIAEDPHSAELLPLLDIITTRIAVLGDAIAMDILPDSEYVKSDFLKKYSASLVGVKPYTIPGHLYQLGDFAKKVLAFSIGSTWSGAFCREPQVLSDKQLVLDFQRTHLKIGDGVTHEGFGPFFRGVEEGLEEGVKPPLIVSAKVDYLKREIFRPYLRAQGVKEEQFSAVERFLLETIDQTNTNPDMHNAVMLGYGDSRVYDNPIVIRAVSGNPLSQFSIKNGKIVIKLEGFYEIGSQDSNADGGGVLHKVYTQYEREISIEDIMSGRAGSVLPTITVKEMPEE